MVHELVLDPDDANVQEAPELKLPPALLLHAIVPVGLVFVPKAVSVATAVKVIVLPTPTVEGFGDTVVAVERVFTVNADMPELVL
jgi:hypothetical protein